MPVAAVTRPLVRPASQLFFRQLPSRGAKHSIAASHLRFEPAPSICLSCSLLRARVRFYSSEPPKSTSSSSSSSSSSSTTPRTTDPEPIDPTPSSPPPTTTAELPSHADSRRSQLSQNFSTFMDNLQSRVLVASQTLSDLTGYSAIEAIKAQNARLESDLAAAQARLTAARASYKDVNTRRASTQREVTTLLARKDGWSPGDLERFTTLYRQDHELESAVAEAGSNLTEAESTESRLSAALNAGILRRYHEEQIWSDRIRRQSTWGTWGLMGVNILLFIVLQFVAEPWKRGRLMRGIAAEEKGALEEVRRELEGVKEALAQREDGVGLDVPAVGVEVVDTDATATVVATEGEGSTSKLPSLSWMELLSDPRRWRPTLVDLYSERRIDIRMRDASIIALEGAVAGAAVVGSLTLLAFRKA